MVRKVRPKFAGTRDCAIHEPVDYRQDFVRGESRAWPRICGQMPSSSRTAASERPSTRINFCRDVSPRSSVTARRGRPSCFAKKSQSASLARPSTAGAWTLTFNASPSQPLTSVRGAFGMALIASVQESATRGARQARVLRMRFSRALPPGPRQFLPPARCRSTAAADPDRACSPRARRCPRGW